MKNCVHQNHLARVRPDRSLFSTETACANCDSSSGRQQQLRSGKTTSDLNTTTASEVVACGMFGPPLALQRRFADIVGKARRAIASVEVGTNGVSVVRVSLMTAFLGNCTWSDSISNRIRRVRIAGVGHEASRLAPRAPDRSVRASVLRGSLSLAWRSHH